MNRFAFRFRCFEVYHTSWISCPFVFMPECRIGYIVYPCPIASSLRAVLPLPKTLISSCAFRGCFLARRKLLAFDFSQTQSYLNSSKLPQRRKLLNGSLPNKTVGAFSFLTLLISFHISGNGIILSHCEAVIPKGGSHKTKSMLDSGRKGITSRQSALYNVMSFAKTIFSIASI